MAHRHLFTSDTSGTESSPRSISHQHDQEGQAVEERDSSSYSESLATGSFSDVLERETQMPLTETTKSSSTAPAQSSSTALALAQMSTSQPKAPTQIFFDSSYLWLLFQGRFFVFCLDKLAVWTRMTNARAGAAVGSSYLYALTTPSALESTFANELVCSPIALPTANTHVDGLVCNDHAYFLWDCMSSTLYSLDSDTLDDPSPEFKIFASLPKDKRPPSMILPMKPCQVSCAVSNSWAACVDLSGCLHVLDLHTRIWYHPISSHFIVSYVLMWREAQLLIVAQRFDSLHTYEFFAISLRDTENIPLVGFPLKFKTGPRLLVNIPDVGVLYFCVEGQGRFLPASCINPSMEQRFADLHKDLTGLNWWISGGPHSLDTMLVSKEGQYIATFYIKPDDTDPMVMLDTFDPRAPQRLSRYTGHSDRWAASKRFLPSAGLTSDLAFFLLEDTDTGNVEMVLKHLSRDSKRWIIDTLVQAQLKSHVDIPDVHWKCCVILILLYALVRTTDLQDLITKKVAEELGYYNERWDLFYVHLLDYNKYVTQIMKEGPIPVLDNDPTVAQLLTEVATAREAYLVSSSTCSLPSFWTSLVQPRPDLQRHVQDHFGVSKPTSQGILDGIKCVYVCTDVSKPTTVVLTHTCVWVLIAPNVVVSHKIQASHVCHDAEGIFLLSMHGLLWELTMANPEKPPLTHIATFPLKPCEGFHRCVTNANCSPGKRGVMAVSSHNIYYWRPSPRLGTSTWQPLNYRSTTSNAPASKDSEKVGKTSDIICVWCNDDCYFTDDAQTLKVLKTRGSGQNVRPVTVTSWKGRTKDRAEVKEWKMFFIVSMTIKYVNGKNPQLAVIYIDKTMSETKMWTLACFNMSSFHEASWEILIPLNGHPNVQIHWISDKPYILAYRREHTECVVQEVHPRSKKEVDLKNITTFSDLDGYVSIAGTANKLWGLWTFPHVYNIQQNPPRLGWMNYTLATGPRHIVFVPYLPDLTNQSDAASSNGGARETFKERAVEATTDAPEKTREQIIEEEVQRDNARVREAKEEAKRAVVPGLQNFVENHQGRPHKRPDDRAHPDNKARQPRRPKRAGDPRDPARQPGTVSSLQALFHGSLPIPPEPQPSSWQFQRNLQERLAERVKEEEEALHIYPKERTSLTEAFGGKAITRAAPGLVRLHRDLDQQSDHDQFHNGAYFRLLCSFILAVYVQFKSAQPVTSPGASSSSSSAPPVPSICVDFLMHFDAYFMAHHTTRLRDIREEWVTEEWRQTPEMEAIVGLARRIWEHTEIPPLDLIQLLGNQIEETWGIDVDIPQLDAVEEDTNA